MKIGKVNFIGGITINNKNISLEEFESLFDKSSSSSSLSNSSNSFNRTFTNEDSQYFSWNENVLTITHGMSSLYNFVAVYDNVNSLIDYPVEVIDGNNIKIYFPEDDIPISGNWNVKIIG